MTARQKIEGLTNSYYGYAVFGALVSLYNSGIGFFSLIGTAFSFMFSIVLTWFIGRRLLAKSSLTRVVLVILSGIFSVLGLIGVAKMGWTFLQTMSFSVLVCAGLVAVGVHMNIKSFRVLTDSSVKAYFS